MLPGTIRNGLSTTALRISKFSTALSLRSQRPPRFVPVETLPFVPHFRPFLPQLPALETVRRAISALWRFSLSSEGAMRVQYPHTGNTTGHPNSQSGFSEAERSADMTGYSMPLVERRVAPAKPELSAAQRALLERKVLTMNSLLHGAHYNGLLDDKTTIGRWHEKRRRFVFWEQSVDQPGSRAVPHVADLGLGSRFAPLSRQEVEAGAHISDFAFETTR